MQFTPRTHEPMLVASLWSHWVDLVGKEPDMLSFAAITDAPEPEVAAAGHDRTIINIKPEHVDAWLNPDPADLGALYAIFDDKRHPFYDHQLAVQDIADRRVRRGLMAWHCPLAHTMALPNPGATAAQPGGWGA